jgi:hypothetical protein
MNSKNPETDSQASQIVADAKGLTGQHPDSSAVQNVFAKDALILSKDNAATYQEVVNTIAEYDKTLEGTIQHLPKLSIDGSPGDGHEFIAASDVQASQTSSPGEPIPQPSSHADWQQTLSNSVTQAWTSISNIPHRTVNSIEEHYQNPYGKGFDADWADMNSAAPIDRRVLDTFKAIFDGPKEAFDRLNAALGS